MAIALAEEERDADLKEYFDLFMEQPKEKQTFIAYKLALAVKIKRQSNHTVMGKLDHFSFPNCIAMLSHFLSCCLSRCNIISLILPLSMSLFQLNLDQKNIPSN
jgi:hypothetical protein